MSQSLIVPEHTFMCTPPPGPPKVLELAWYGFCRSFEPDLRIAPFMFDIVVDEAIGVEDFAEEAVVDLVVEE